MEVCKNFKKSNASINEIYKQLTLIENEDKIDIGIEVIKVVQSKSFITSATSGAIICDSSKIRKELSKPVGVVFKSDLNSLFKTVFLALKKMNIVWKKWNSDFIYK
jgi:hypothetical protein